MGDLNATSYRNGTIIECSTNYNTSSSALAVDGNISDISDISVKINGKIYKFSFLQKNAGVSQFISNEIIFVAGHEYTIEFLN